ncbi:MAG: hypothetical protein ACREB8_01420 [Pseudolabrys sp.]
MVEPGLHDELQSPRLPGRPFILLVAGVALFLSVSFGGLRAVFVYNVPDRIPLPAQQPPAPRLLADPPAELSAVLSQQRARLAGYHWVDRGKKIVSIPIDRAMAIVASRGADAFAPIPGAPPPPEPNIPGILENLRTQEAQPAPTAAHAPSQSVQPAGKP